MVSKHGLKVSFLYRALTAGQFLTPCRTVTFTSVVHFFTYLITVVCYFDPDQSFPFSPHWVF